VTIALGESGSGADKSSQVRCRQVQTVWAIANAAVDTLLWHNISLHKSSKSCHQTSYEVVEASVRYTCTIVSVGSKYNGRKLEICRKTVNLHMTD
jgi:hypothetical protein